MAEDYVDALPAGEVLAGLAIPALPDGARATELIALIKYDDADGKTAFAVRLTADFDPDEQLGVLVSYVEHLKQESASTWNDAGTTAPS
jgi:hypothetical protein